MAMAAGLWDDVAPGGRVIICGASGPGITLSAIASSGRHGSPVLLVTTARLPDVVRTTLERLAPTQIVLCGVVDALPPDLRRTLGEIVAPVASTVDVPQE